MGYISERQVQKLCKADRIEGIVRLSRVWLIPSNTEKPKDRRFKNNRKAGAT